MILSVLAFVSPAILLLALMVPVLQWCGRVSRDIGYRTTGLTVMQHLRRASSLKNIESQREATRLSDQETAVWQNIVKQLRAEDS